MKTGEIWKVESGSRTDYAVVVSDNDRVCTILKLNETGYEGDLQFNCKGLKYCNPAMISYSFRNNFVDYVRTLTDEEFENVLSSVSKKLGIEQKVVTKEVPVEVTKEIEVPVESGNTEEIARLKAEAAIYKNMYDELLHRMLKGGSNE